MSSYAAGTHPSSHTAALVQTSPPSTSPERCGYPPPRHRMLFHHSLQLPLFIPLPPPLVSLTQNKVARGCLALALMGKLDLGGLVSLQIQSPGRIIRVSVCGHSSSRASPAGLECQPASLSHPTTLQSLQPVIEERVTSFSRYLPYLQADSVPCLSFPSCLYTVEVSLLSPEASTLPGLSPYSCPSPTASQLLRAPAEL